jgi:hypothetical protein
MRSRIITLQQSKSGKKRMIPIDDTLFETLKNFPSRVGQGVVFPTNRKDGENKAGGKLTDTNKTFTRLAEKAGIKEVRFHTSGTPLLHTS